MKSLYFTEDHETFRKSVREFIEKEVAPYAEAWEKQKRIPRDIWQKMGREGLLGINYPETYGGSEADFFYSVVFLEELPRSTMGGFVAAVSVHEYMATQYIFKFGSEELKQQYLQPAIQGEKIGALAITEPNTGSDVAAIRTRAIRQGDFYVLNGAKTFITNGVYGDFIVVAAKTDPEAGAGGISLFVVDRHSPGLTAKNLNKIGWHSSDTAELTFEDVHVPAQNLIGEENQGFYYIMKCFQLERLVAAITSYAGAERCLEITLRYIQEREAFKKPLSKFQVIRHQIADLISKLEAAKQLTLHTSWLYQQGEPAVKECSMAKLLTTELAAKIADRCLQFFGGYGYMEEYLISRIYRDARVGTIVGGTSEIMKEIIARMVIDGTDYRASGIQATHPASQTRTLSSAEKVAPLAAAEMEIPQTAAEIIRSLPQRFRPEKAGNYETIVHFDISGAEGGKFTVTIEKGQCKVKEGLYGDPRCVVKTKDKTYADIELGKMNPQAAILMGKIKIQNLAEMMRFIKLFRRIQSVRNGNPAPAPSVKTSRKPRSGPLQGIRILDLSRLYPGPLATMMMADMGAEVIKIEHPADPDPMRQYPPFVGKHSAGYLAVNRSKKSLALNLESAEGKEIFFKLTRNSDIVVESFRPGVLNKLGIDFQQAQAINPDIIYVSVTGYGQQGTYSLRASHDLNYLALSGILSITGTPERPVIPGAQVADIAGGAYMTIIACLSALWYRRQSGKGQQVDVAMLDGSLPLLTLQLAHYWATGEKPQRGAMVLNGGMAAYNVYECADGKWMALAAIEPKFWETFCEAVKHPEWKDNYFVSGKDQEQLIQQVMALFKQKPQSYWIKLAEKHDMCLTPVLEFEELEKHPYFQNRKLILEGFTGNKRQIKELNVPLKFSAVEARPSWASPELGEDTLAILKEYQFSDEEIKKLKEKGVIYFSS